jgi:hypothetical protein
MTLLRRGWILTAYVDAVILLFVNWASAPRIFSEGVTPYQFDLGTFVFTSYVVVVNIRVALEAHFHHLRFQVWVAMGIEVLLLSSCGPMVSWLLHWPSCGPFGVCRFWSGSLCWRPASSFGFQRRSYSTHGTAMA